MTSRPIVTLGDPRLRVPGERVRVFDKGLHRLLDEMTQSMREAPGVGLAAQQVGLALQVCVIEIEGQVHELVNPRIVHLSGEQEDYEGCLSIPGFYAIRKRAMKAVVEGQNRHGKKVRVSGTGLLARAIQHEFDHLQGELYIDALGPNPELVPAAELQEEPVEVRRAAAVAAMTPAVVETIAAATDDLVGEAAPRGEAETPTEPGHALEHRAPIPVE